MFAPARRIVAVLLSLGSVVASSAEVRAQTGPPVSAIVPCPRVTPAPVPSAAPSAVPSPSPTPLVAASASPLPDATATATPAATPTPTPRPSAPPLSLAPAKLQLNAGMCARVIVSGGVAPYSPSAGTGNVSVGTQPDGSIVVFALRNGRDVVTVADAAGTKATEPVLVAPDAGVLPATVTLRLAGRVVPPEFAAGALAAEVARRAHLQPGAHVSAISARLLPASLATGATWPGTIPITLSGRDRWRDVTGSVPVQIQVVEMPPLAPALLFFSDDPEKVLAAQAGVLFRATLPAATAVRLLTFAQFETTGRQLFVLLRSAGTSHVQVLGDVAGPGFYDDAGHKASVRYLLARHTQQSVITTVAPDDPAVLEIGAATQDPHRVVTGIYDFRLLDGAPTDVLIVAGFDASDPRAFANEAAHADFEDTHFRAGIYPLDAVPPIALSASVGVKFRTSTSAGTSAIVGSWAVPPIVGQRYLTGDYGVVRPFRLTMTNVSDQPGTVYFYEKVSPDGVTTTVFFDGEPKPLELPCMKTPKDDPTRYLIRKFTVPPGGAPLVVTGEYMTDGGSAYPIELGLSVDAPLDAPAKSICTAT